MANEKPEEWPLTLVRGDSWIAESFRVIDTTTSTPMVVSEVVQQIKHSFTKELVKTFTHTNGLVITEAGTLVTYDVSNIVNDLPVGRYLSDVQVKLANGTTRTIYRRTITITEDISN